MCSYLFVGMAYGILMEEAGFPWYDSLLVSMMVYTGGLSVRADDSAVCRSICADDCSNCIFHE